MIENYPENKSASKISDKENSEAKQTLIDGMSAYSLHILYHWSSNASTTCLIIKYLHY